MGVTVMAIMSACNSNITDFKTINLTYPSTKRDTTIKDIYFGTEVTDPYRWLENDTAANTKAWVIAQNKVTFDYLDKIPFRKKINERLTDLWNYDSYSAPSTEGDYIYFYKKTGLQNQSVLYRQKKGSQEPEVFLDPNSFSKDGTTSLAGISFSTDGSLAAYQISEGGSDWRKVIIIDAITKKQIGDTLYDVKFSGISFRKKEGIYYSSYDKPKEGSTLAGKTDKHKLYFHLLNTSQKNDQLIFGGETMPRRYVSGYVSENEKWLFITGANSTYGNELYLQDLTKPNAPIIPIQSNTDNTTYPVYITNESLILQTDKDAPNTKLVIVPISSPEQKNWKDFVAEKPEVMSASSAGDAIFCTYLKDAISKVEQYDLSGKKIRDIDLPGLGDASGFGGKETDKEVFYTFRSYTQPATIYKMNIAAGKSEVYKKPEIKFDGTNYESKQVFYTSKDGTKIPMMITYKKGIKLDGNNPTLLYGYGGFSSSLTPYFSTSNIILLENGGVFATANLRGGGEYGEKWHLAGTKLNKQNVFDDFKAAAAYLVDNKYTSKEKLAIQGESNGGLLIGATITQDPGICKVAFPFVGVMDMLRYHKFTAGAGWAYDYGTADDSKEMFEYLRKYSPVHNVKEAEYPATLVMTADHDDRVVPAHSFKFIAALQEKAKGSNPRIIRIDTKAGHGTMSLKQRIESETDKWAFMFYNMKIEPK